MTKEKGKLPSGFKTREEYNAYMREYRAQKKEEAQALQQQQPANIVPEMVKRGKQLKPEQISVKPEDTDELTVSNILGFGYYSYMNAVNLFSKLEKWDFIKIYEDQVAIIRMLIQQASKTPTEQYITIYQATFNVYNEILKKHALSVELCKNINAHLKIMREIYEICKRAQEELKAEEEIVNRKQPPHMVI